MGDTGSRNSDADEDDPDDRERRDPLVVVAEAPRARARSGRPARIRRIDRQREGDVEADHGDRGADEVADRAVGQGREHQRPGQHADRDHGVDRHPVAGDLAATAGSRAPRGRGRRRTSSATPT